MTDTSQLELGMLVNHKRFAYVMNMDSSILNLLSRLHLPLKTY